MRAARRLRVLDGRRRRKRDAVLSALLPGPLWGRELARRLRHERGCGNKHLHRYLRRLARDGLLVAAARGPGPTGRVYWTLTEAGRLVCLRFALPGGGIVDKADRERVVAGGMAAVLSEQQIVVAAWYWFEGRTQREIAGWLRCSRGAVLDRTRLIRWKLAAAGLPEPRRLRRPAG